MSRKLLLPVIVILMFSVLISRAQKSRHAALKDGNTYARLVSTNQWTNLKDGRQESGYTYTVVWKGTKPPETFFWRPKEGGWMTCAVVRVHPRSNAGNTVSQQYEKEEIELSQIRKGDTLDITPLRGGRDIMPKIIPPAMTNRLFFMVKGNINWWQVGTGARKK